jgi:hypothetical protein
VISSYETSVHMWTELHYIPQDGNIHCHYFVHEDNHLHIHSSLVFVCLHVSCIIIVLFSVFNWHWSAARPLSLSLSYLFTRRNPTPKVRMIWAPPTPRVCPRKLFRLFKFSSDMDMEFMYGSPFALFSDALP